MLRLMERTKDVRCVYLGDTANFPYGEKSPEEIIQGAVSAVDLLTENFSPNVIVTACNTISVSALAELRKRFPIPFVGTVPAIRLAGKISRNGKIGLVATRFTVESDYTRDLIKEFAPNCLVLKRADPQLVDFVEKRLFDATPEEKRAACMPTIKEFSQCDTIILGCTHFVHLREAFQEAVPSGVQVVDSCDGVVERVLKQLENVPDVPSIALGENSLFVTSSSHKDEYEKLCSRFGLKFGGILKKNS
ncbi:MAG: glutamate racemase [Spirochaetaceae bacterium]|nr:glutamate racemase [Spirochaetaceae bacterium]